MKYTIILLFLFCYYNFYGQKNSKALDSPSDITLKPSEKICERLILSIETCQKNNPDSVGFYEAQAEECVKTTSNLGIKFLFYEKVINSNIIKLDFKKSFYYLKQAEQLALKLKSTKNLAKTYRRYSTVYEMLDSINIAIKYINMSTHLYVQMKDTENIILTTLNFTYLCNQETEFEKMYEMLNGLNLRYLKKINSSTRLKARVLDQRAMYYNSKKQFNKAIPYLKEAIEVLKKDTSAKLISVFLDIKLNLAQSYINTFIINNNKLYLDTALKEVNAVAEIATKNQRLTHFPRMYLITSNIYLLQEKFKKSITISNRAIEFMRKYEYKLYINEFYVNLYSAFDTLNIKDSALYYLKKINTLTVNQNDAYITKLINKAEVEKKLAIEKKEIELQLLEKDKLISIRNLSILLLLSGLLILIFIFLIRLQYIKQKQKVEFTSQLLKNIEKENQKLSRELHDSIGQGLLLLNLQSSEKYYSIIKPLINEVRSISKNLSPLYIDNVSIVILISNLIATVKEHSTIYFSFDIDKNIELNNEKKLHLYRIIQESISNVIKHSQAKNCRIMIEQTDEKLNVLIIDDGIGFELKKLNSENIFGINSLHQRAAIMNAKLKITSSKNKGTKITIEF